MQLRAKPVLPSGLFKEVDLYIRRRWRQVQYLVDLFWKRWVKEYFPTNVNEILFFRSGTDTEVFVAVTCKEELGAGMWKLLVYNTCCIGVYSL